MKDKHLYEFGGFVLDLEAQTLSQFGKPISITPKIFLLLEVLIKNHGQILEKDELMKQIWADTFVEESNLTYSIRQLRKILDDDFNQPKFIETVQRRGYRFIGKIERLNDLPVEIIEEKKDELLVESKTFLSQIFQRKVLSGMLAAIFLCLIGGSFVYFNPQNNRNVTEKQRSLAILPFTNLKPDEETNHLGFAFADTLNTKLTSMRNFRVFPSSLMAKYNSPQDFLSEQKADFLVTGTYLKENGKLKITSQVFNSAKNETLFQDSFELNDEQLSQTSEIIARRLINELRLRPQEISKYSDMSDINPQAFNFFSKGIEQYSKSKLSDSIENLEKAVKIEPKFAAAWDKLGDSYLVSASTHFGGADYYQKAENAYRKAIEIDSVNILPQLHLTNILTETNRKEEAVEILLKLAEKEPENPMVWWELSYVYRYAGRLEKSIEAGEKAHQLDPGFFLNASAPNYYLYAGNYQKFKDAMSSRTDSAYIKFYQGFAEYHLNNKAAAKRLFDEAFQLDSDSMQSQIGKALSYTISNENEAAENLLLKIEKEIYDKKVSDGEGIYKVSQAFAVLGNKAKALELFDLSVETGFFCYPYFQNDLLNSNLRNEKKFIEVSAKAKKYYEGFRY